MKPFQTKAVQLVLVAVALVLGYATLASAASTPHCRVSEPAATGTVPLQWTVMATTSATEPNGNAALASAPVPRQDRIFSDDRANGDYDAGRDGLGGRRAI